MSKRPTPTEVLSVRLKEERTRACLTQEQLAERADVSVSHIAQMERKARLPSLAILDRVAAALGLTVGDLLSSPGERREHTRYITQFIEWLEEKGVNHDEVVTLKSAANLLIQRRK